MNTISSHFAFEEHWNELPAYAGYFPVQYRQSWQLLKSEFYSSGKYGPERPLPVDIKKDNNIMVVNVYGFRVPDAPPVICLGTDAATRGRIVFCKVLATKELIAIAW